MDKEKDNTTMIVQAPGNIPAGESPSFNLPKEEFVNFNEISSFKIRQETDFEKDEKPPITERAETDEEAPFSSRPLIIKRVMKSQDFENSIVQYQSNGNDPIGADDESISLRSKIQKEDFQILRSKTLMRQNTQQTSLKTILGPDFEKLVQLPMHDAAEYFDDPETKKQCEIMVSQLFKTDEQHNQNKNLWKSFGMKPEVFLKSALNPYKQGLMCKHDHHGEEDCGDDEQANETLCQKIIENILGTQQNHGHERRPFYELLVISEDSEWYNYFNMLVTILCLISGYYYGAIAGFRYSNLETDGSFHYIWQLVLETIFFMHMMTQFVLEVRVAGQANTVRNPLDISRIYLRTNFAIDFITMIPLQFLNLKRKRQYMFYAIKLLRIKKGFRLFDVQKMMSGLKNRYKQKQMLIIEYDHELANNVDVDNNKIEELLWISYVLKTLKLIIIISNCCFLTGVFWLMLCEFNHDFIYDIDPQYDKKQEHDLDLFIVYFGIENMDRMDSLIIAMYFAFTSLSTVGFGDYHPRGDIERIFGGYMLLFGVAIFSYILSIFRDIIQQVSTFNADLDDGDNLAKFFGIMKHFNGEQKISQELETKITHFFEYKWKNDRLAAFQLQDDLDLCDQLPSDVQCKIFVAFLYKDFLRTYQKTFTFQNPFCSNQPAYYTFDSHNYMIFMLDILSHLEPRQELQNTIILNELDEVNEVIFFYKGICDVGFEINRLKEYVLRMDNSIIIGDFCTSFNKRSKFVYKTYSICQGYSMRKSNWIEILENEDHKILSSMMKKRIKKQNENFTAKVEQQKDVRLQKWLKRADYEATLRVVVNPKVCCEGEVTSEESLYAVDDDPFGNIGMITKFHHFIDRTGAVINNYRKILDDSNKTMIKLKKIKEQNDRLKKENAFLSKQTLADQVSAMSNNN